MSKIKLQIKTLGGSVLFEYEKEDNTVLKTVKEAVKLKKDLTGADLRGAYLTGADLRGADLRGADLRGADLRGADLTGADLTGADLRGAYLTGADLRGADLRGAYLTGADLTGADLRGAYLTGADLRGAYLTGAKIKTAAVLKGLYTYIVIPYITADDIKRIKMGCYDRTLEEWEANFWNNESEFPNDGSLNSNLRLMAYNTAKAWFELIDKDMIANPDKYKIEAEVKE